MFAIQLVPEQINLNWENVALGIAALIVAFGIAVMVHWFANNR